MNEFWRRLIEMERRQDRANHMMTRSSDQIDQAKVDNYKGGIFAPIENVGKLESGYNVIGVYPFSYDGIWVSAAFESSEPTFTGPTPLTAQSRQCLAVHQYDGGEEWAGYNSFSEQSNLPFFSRPQSRNYPFKVTWDTTASAAGSKWVFAYDGGNMLNSYWYRIFQPMSFTYDWKRGKLNIKASISAHDIIKYPYTIYGWRWVQQQDLPGSYAPYISTGYKDVEEWIYVTCDYWLDFDPDNPPFSGEAGSITVPATFNQLKINLNGLPLADLQLKDPDDPNGPDAFPQELLPDWLKGNPSGYHPAGTNFNQYCAVPGVEGSVNSASSICSSGPATFTFRWDKPSEACLDDDPMTECVWKHWDEYDN